MDSFCYFKIGKPLTECNLASGSVLFELLFAIGKVEFLSQVLERHQYEQAWSALFGCDLHDSPTWPPHPTYHTETIIVE